MTAGLARDATELAGNLQAHNEWCDSARMLLQWQQSQPFGYHSNRHESAEPTMNWLREPAGPCTRGEFAATSAK